MSKDAEKADDEKSKGGGMMKMVIGGVAMLGEQIYFMSQGKGQEQRLIDELD